MSNKSNLFRKIKIKNKKKSKSIETSPEPVSRKLKTSSNLNLNLLKRKTNCLLKNSKTNLISVRKCDKNLNLDKMENTKLEYQLTDKEYTAYKEAFELFDNDRNGYIDKQELLRMCHSLGEYPSDSQLDIMISKADTLNRDGQIEFDEFVNFMKSNAVKHRSRSEDMKAAFKVFDKDGNGIIDREELRFAMENLGEILTEAELDSMIQEADCDGDGLISFDEFSKMFLAESS